MVPKNLGRGRAVQILIKQVLLTRFGFISAQIWGGGRCPLPASSPRSAGPAHVLLSYAVCNQLCRNKPLFSKSFVILNVAYTHNGKSLEIETMQKVLFKTVVLLWFHKIFIRKFLLSISKCREIKS